MPLISIALVSFAFLLFFAGAFSRGYVRSHLAERGVKLKQWVNISDEYVYAAQYFKLARRSNLPVWPAILNVAALPLAFALIVAGLMLAE